jgi:hypothetical protein
MNSRRRVNSDVRPTEWDWIYLWADVGETMLRCISIVLAVAFIVVGGFSSAKTSGECGQTSAPKGDREGWRSRRVEDH